MKRVRLLCMVVSLVFVGCNANQTDDPQYPVSQEVKNDFKLATQYHLGRDGVEQDLALAVSHYTIAAQKNHCKALFNLAFFYRKGLGGLKKDKQKAFDCYFRAAESGHESSIFKCANIFECGSMGIKKDIPRAVTLYEALKEKGHVGAQLNLAGLYSLGEVEGKNEEDACIIWQELAGKNCALACYNLAYYKRLVGNHDEARALYERAAALGDKDALLRLKDFDQDMCAIL